MYRAQASSSGVEAKKGVADCGPATLEHVLLYSSLGLMLQQETLPHLIFCYYRSVLLFLELQMNTIRWKLFLGFFQA